MSDERTCPTCDGALPPDAPEGACPRCLLAAGFESADGLPAAETPELSDVAQRFPELEILEEVGRGGMGVVYRARQKRLDRLVALKVLPHEIVASAPDAARFEDRFTREARALARLSHPNIVAVHEFGDRDGLYFFLMEYVDGANLRETMRAGRLSPAEALAIVPQICDALQYAHDQGVVHRDIKPENILLDRDGKVKIADFGLAKLVTRAADDRTLTRQGLVMGTPHYMAPEQLEKPSEVDHRADIYSLGVVLYEMLTGELPIGRFAAPSEKVHVDVRLDEVVLRSLEKDASRRYQAVSEVKTGIGLVNPDGVAADEPPPERSVNAVRQESRYSKLAMWGFLLPIVAAALGVIAMVAIVGLAGPSTPSQGMGVTFSTIGGLVGLAVLAGIALSVAGMVHIHRNRGRVHGMGLAIAGLLMPVLCCLPGVGVSTMWLTTRGTPVRGPMVAGHNGLPDPSEPPAAPLAPGVEEHEDLGTFRFELQLGADEAASEPKSIWLSGLGKQSMEAHLSTSSEMPLPPAEGTQIWIADLAGNEAACLAGARLMVGDEELARLTPLNPDGGSVVRVDRYVAGDRFEDLRVEFDAGDEQQVIVTGRVVQPEER